MSTRGKLSKRVRFKTRYCRVISCLLFAVTQHFRRIETMATVGYARVSSTGQNLDVQLDKLSNCERVFKEKCSGIDTDRSELRRCLDHVREGDTLLVTKIDRLARSTKRFVLNMAIGMGATASGNGMAIGTNAFAAGAGDVAVGQGARVEADNGSSFGTGATVRAGHTGSTALGAGATTTRANQVMMGTVSTTYTTPGITSAASKAAQGSPTHIVTSNAGGDLAAHTFSELGLATTGDVSILQGQINSLARRDDKLAEGIAATVALAQPILLPGQHFAMRAGWGGYDDANAFGFSAAGVVAGNLLSQGRGTLTLDGGVGFGTDEGEVAGRAGASFGW
jgi:Resolvase, N terminal domain